MLEARLLVELVKAKTMWITPPYYTNDAQDVIRIAIAMAADTEWEDRLDRVLNPEYSQTYEQLLETFLACHLGVTEKNLYDADHEGVNREFTRVCQDADRENNDHTIACLDSLVEMLCTTIGDKIHRRNLQIADLKRSIQVTEGSLKRLMSTPPPVTFTATEAKFMADTISDTMAAGNKDIGAQERILGKLAKIAKS